MQNSFVRFLLLGVVSAVLVACANSPSTSKPAFQKENPKESAITESAQTLD